MHSSPFSAVVGLARQALARLAALGRLALPSIEELPAVVAGHWNPGGKGDAFSSRCLDAGRSVSTCKSHDDK